MPSRFKMLLKRSALKVARPVLEIRRGLARADLPQFGNRPENLTIEPPRAFCAPERVFIGDDVYVGPEAMILAILILSGRALARSAQAAGVADV